MKGLANMTAAFPKNRANRIAAYAATLYYLEVIALMFGLLFLYGKTVAIMVGAALTLLLTCHIIRLYLGYNIQRKIQLFIIDLHAAFAAGFIFYSIAQTAPVESSSLPLLIMRAGILACELPLLLLLTGDEARRAFR